MNSKSASDLALWIPAHPCRYPCALWLLKLVIGQPINLFLGFQHALWWNPPRPSTCLHSSPRFTDFTASSDTFFFKTVQIFSLTTALLAFHSYEMNEKSIIPNLFSVYFSVCPLNTAAFLSSPLDFLYSLFNWHYCHIESGNHFHYHCFNYFL